MSFTMAINDESRKRCRTIADLIGDGATPEGAVGVAARVNGELVDLTSPLPEASEIEVLTFADEAGREVHRHSASHVLAQAVKRLFPEAKLAIGPAIAEGFYYDFDLSASFTPEDLERIEAEMRKIVAEDIPFERQALAKDEAAARFVASGDLYKIELLEGIEDPAVSLYRDGDFVDLCRGPHLPSTGAVGAVKLLSVAGAYWRGDEHRQMLQRIYGTAFPTQAELDEYLERREEAARRDHRRLGRELDLFSIHDEIGPGLILWHPKGAQLRESIETFWKAEHRKRGYQLVTTPHIAQIGLWETSGHTEFYKENMFFLDIDEQRYVLKPMNCPEHILIYKTHTRSYRDLPIRLAELGTVYRYERSGVLHGMLRVRGFTQDDAHIFCAPEQLKEEVGGVVEFAQFMLRAFGFPGYEARLSTRPAHFAGEPEEWDLAEETLAEVLREHEIPFEVDAGEAVFYGPKIDIHLRDSLGRLWQGPTIQFDFNLARRFDVTYVGADGKPHPVVMVHRVLLGSMERFVGALIEQHAGAFPAWLAPVQAIILPIAERHQAAAEELRKRLIDLGYRVEMDVRKEGTGRKVRDAQMMKIPYMLVLGDREVEAGTVAVRDRERGDLGAIGWDELEAMLARECAPGAAAG